MHDQQPGTMLTPNEAWNEIGTDKISRSAFYKALRRNEIPNRRCGRRFLIPRHAFMLWLRGDGPGMTAA